MALLKIFHIQNKENEDVKLTKMTNKGIENEVG